jgi:hypothetical protein
MDEKRIIEINGVKLEIDMSPVKCIDEFNPELPRSPPL